MNQHTTEPTVRLLDGSGGARVLSTAELDAWRPEQGVVWVHLDYALLASHAWLSDQSDIPPVYVETLISEQPRPRCLLHGDHMLVVLRGVNLNPGADPEDIVSIRLWIGPERVVSTCHRPVLAAADVATALDDGRGPRTAGEVLVELVDRITERLGTVVAEVDESVDDLEDQVVSAESRGLRSALAGLRRQVIALRRYVSPQRESVGRLWTERVAWLTEVERAHLREAADRTVRYVEDLDASRDRAAVTMEELANRLSEQMNSKLYVLSLVAAVFLPLGLLTGLLGINVGGVPGTDSPVAFWLVSGGLVGLAAIMWVYFKRARWL